MQPVIEVGAEEDDRPIADVLAARRAADPRQFTVLVEDDSGGPALADPTYPAGIFEVPSEGDLEPTLVAIVAVANLEGRLLVAFPFSVWHRVAARRILPVRCLSKAVSVEVPFEDRTSAGGDPGRHKIWLGFLSAEFESAVNFETSLEESTLDYCFVGSNPFVLPAAASLLEVAQQQGPFESAASGVEAPLSGGDLTQRLQKLEASVASLAEGLKQLTPPSRQPTTSRPSALRASPKPRATSSPSSCPPGLEPVPAAGLDLEVLRAAREVGIPDSHLTQMTTLASKGKPKLTDTPLPPKTAARRNVLSEREDEDELVPAGDETDGGGDQATLATAVTKLTKIAEHLAGKKKKERSLDAVLDGIGSGHTETSGLIGPRKSAAALRALRKALVTQPEEIFRSIERRMEEDFNLRGQVPGGAGVQLTARSWLEMRSRVQNFQTPVRFPWAIAGIHECLRQQRYSEARARACLALAGGDQLSIDRGSWLIAGEMMLEDPPPLSSFATHPLPQEHEAPFTHLVDGRWVDLFVQKLSEFEALAEKKKKLGKGPPVFNPPNLAAPGGKGDLPNPNPKRKAKAQPKSKGSGGYGGAADAEAGSSSQMN